MGWHQGHGFALQAKAMAKTEPLQCDTSGLQVFYNYFISVIQVLTSVLQVCYKFLMIELQGCYECVTSVLWVCYKCVMILLQICVTSILWVRYECVSSVLQVFYKSVTHVLQVSYKWVASVLRVCIYIYIFCIVASICKPPDIQCLRMRDYYFGDGFAWLSLSVKKVQNLTTTVKYLFRWKEDF